jgi:sarcosine oxidase subunit alpha
VNGREIRCAPDITLAAALLNAGISGFRSSVGGAQRGPVCGMGVCFECRVTVDGIAHQRACMLTVRDGMDVRAADALPHEPGQ